MAITARAWGARTDLSAFRTDASMIFGRAAIDERNGLLDVFESLVLSQRLQLLAKFPDDFLKSF